MTSMNISAEDTLPDSAWKDSFDKLLDERPELNVIKRDVRASINMNSSYENSGYNNSDSMKLPRSPLLQNMNATKESQQLIKTKVVSTPIKSTTANPFKCTISPIGTWNLKHFKCNNGRNDSKIYFNATPINNVVDMENIEVSNSSNIRKDYITPRYSLGISPLEIVRKKWNSKQAKKHVSFVSNDVIRIEENTVENLNQNMVDIMSPPLQLHNGLQPGKWRKSLHSLRRLQNPSKRDTDTNLLKTQYQKRQSMGDFEKTELLKAARSVTGKRKSIFIHPNSNSAQKDSRSTYSLECNDFKRQVLRRCGQRRVLNFSSAFNSDYLKNCCKIGEGAFGEVFLYSKDKEHIESENTDKTVLKIIPIEGKELVNGEVQKTFEEILPEIIISMELCGLNNDNCKPNSTSGFVNLQRVRCVTGQYPSYLQKLWEDYDLRKESENDHPKCFTNDQQYIVLELAYGGKDLEGFHFKNAEQSYYALQQIILTLAVGEKEYQFEHRDLHWGNILVLNTNQQYVSYKLDDKLLTVPTKGIQITIIDYTLSRMTFNDYCFYNDLSNDEELFTATGDYQFEIYRMMREAVNNKWETFEPKTNILWISYIISKLVNGVLYKSMRSKNHLYYLDKLKKLQTSILTFKNCVDCARDILLEQL